MQDPYVTFKSPQIMCSLRSNKHALIANVHIWNHANGRVLSYVYKDFSSLLRTKQLAHQLHLFALGVIRNPCEIVTGLCINELTGN